jgi:hypothetical protein
MLSGYADENVKAAINSPYSSICPPDRSCRRGERRQIRIEGLGRCFKPLVIQKNRRLDLEKPSQRFDPLHAELSLAG